MTRKEKMTFSGGRLELEREGCCVPAPCERISPSEGGSCAEGGDSLVLTIYSSSVGLVILLPGTAQLNADMFLPFVSDERNQVLESVLSQINASAVRRRTG